MILYLSPGACSLASHIALHEADIDFERVAVDLKTHRTEDGRDFYAINPKGYVPCLELDEGRRLTENVAVLSWVADQAPELCPEGEFGRYRLLEALAFISTEIHKSFKPFFSAEADEAAKRAAAETIAKRLEFIAGQLRGDYLFGEAVSVADAYLFVMLSWAGKNGVAVPGALKAFEKRMHERPAVKLALRHEDEAKARRAAREEREGAEAR